MNNPKSTIQIAGHPIHPMLVPLVIGSYAGAFGADIGYAATADPFWARGAIWLMGAGIIASLLAAPIGLIDFLAEPRIRALPIAWYHFIGNAVMSVISIIDWLLRYRVGAEAGSQSYLWLSLLVVVMLLVNGWFGWEMVSKHRVGVADQVPGLQ